MSVIKNLLMFLFSFSFKKTSLNAPVCNVHSSIAASSLLMGDNVLNQTHAGVQEQELEEDEEQNHRRRKVEPMCKCSLVFWSRYWLIMNA